MRKLYFLAVFLSLILAAQITFAFSAGEKVSVEWKGKWYTATILKTLNNQYYIHYDGYEAEWDEWVSESRIKSLTAATTATTTVPGTTGVTFAVGDAVQVLWKEKWWPAKVLQVGENQWQIKYDGYGDEWNEWVGSSRIKK